MVEELIPTVMRIVARYKRKFPGHDDEYESLALYELVRLVQVKGYTDVKLILHSIKQTLKRVSIEDKVIRVPYSSWKKQKDLLLTQVDKIIDLTTTDCANVALYISRDDLLLLLEGKPCRKKEKIKRKLIELLTA